MQLFIFVFFLLSFAEDGCIDHCEGWINCLEIEACSQCLNDPAVEQTAGECLEDSASSGCCTAEFLGAIDCHFRCYETDGKEEEHVECEEFDASSGEQCTRHSNYCNGHCDFTECAWENEGSWHSHVNGVERAYCIRRDSCSDGYELVAQWNQANNQDEVVCIEIDLNREVSQIESKPDDQSCHEAFGNAPEGWEWSENWSTGHGQCKQVKNCDFGHQHWSLSMDEVVCPLIEEKLCPDGSHPRSDWDDNTQTSTTFCQDSEQNVIHATERSIIFHYSEHVDDDCERQFEGGSCNNHEHYCNGYCSFEDCDWENEASWYTHGDGQERSFCLPRDSCSEGYHVVSQWSAQNQNEVLVCLKIQELEVVEEHHRPADQLCDQAFGAAPEGFAWGEDWSTDTGMCKLMSTCGVGHRHWSPSLSAEVCPMTTELTCGASPVRESWNDHTMTSSYFCQNQQNVVVDMTERTIDFYDHHQYTDDAEGHNGDKPSWIYPDYSTTPCEDDPEQIMTSMGETCSGNVDELGACNAYHHDLFGYERWMWAVCPMTCGACAHPDVMTVHFAIHSNGMCMDEIDSDVASFVLNTCHPEVRVIQRYHHTYLLHG